MKPPLVAAFFLQTTAKRPRRLLLVPALLVAVVAVAGCAPGFPRPATDITATSATLNGDVASSKGGTVHFTFAWGTTRSVQNSAEGDVETEKNVKAPISVAIDNLEPQTLYYFQVCGNDDGNDVCSSLATFTTLEEHSQAAVRPGPPGLLTFDSGIYRENRVSIRQGSTPSSYVITDSRDPDHPNQGSFIDPGAGCSQLSPDSVECADPTITGFLVTMRDGDDQFDNVDVLGTYGVFGATAYGGGGNDVFHGSSGDDDFKGDSGADDFFGGAGNDFIDAQDGGQDGVIDCGQGGELPGFGDSVSLDPEEFEAHTDVNCENRG